MSGLEKFVQNSELQFKYLINLALNQKVTWSNLKSFLNDLTPTHQTSKKINDILLEELQNLHSKIIDNQARKNGETEADFEDFVKSGSDDDIMVLFTKQKTIGDDLTEHDFVHESISGETNNDQDVQHDQLNEHQIPTNEEPYNDYSEDAEDIDAKDIESKTPDDHDLVDGTTLLEDEDQNTDNTNDMNDKKDVNSVHHKSKVIQEESNIGAYGKDSTSSNKDKVKKKRYEKRKKVYVNGERRYSCETCGQLLTNVGSLKRHERNHSGEKPYQCKYCDKRFNYPQSHRQHERLHTGEKPYECKTCGKAFAQLSALSAHRTHSNEKPLECKNCPSRFKSKQEVNQHQRTHTREKLFKCEQCQNETKYIDS